MNPQRGEIIIQDLIWHLSSLARLNCIETSASEGFRLLSRALRPHSKRPISELFDIIAKDPLLAYPKGFPEKESVQLPPNIQDICLDEVQNILEDRNYTREQLVELGVERFNLPKHRLVRSSRNKLIESIDLALEHEKSLKTIAKAARLSGKNRRA